MAKHNWTAIEAAFVEGEKAENGERSYPTLKQVAVRYGVGINYVYKKAAEEKWTAKREAFIARVEKARVEVKVRNSAGVLADLDQKVFDRAVLLIATYDKALSEHRNAVQGGDGAKNRLTVYELNALGAGYDAAHRMARRAMDAPTDIVDGMAPVEGAGVSGMLKQARERRKARAAANANTAPSPDDHSAGRTTG